MTNQDFSITMEDLGKRKTYEVFAAMPGEPSLSLSLRLRMDEGAPPRCAAAFSSMFLPCLRSEMFAALSETLHRAISGAASLIPDRDDRVRAEGAFNDLFALEAHRLAYHWQRRQHLGLEPRLMRAIDRKGKPRGPAFSGLAAPRTSLGPKADIGFWRDEGRVWTAGQVEVVPGSADMEALRHGANSHDLIAMLSREGLEHPLLRAAASKMLGGKPPRPFAVFQHGTAACRASSKIRNEGGLHGFFNAPGNAVQHLSLGYNGTGPALSIFTLEDRIRICDVQNRSWSFSSRTAFEQSIVAWIALLAALDLQPARLKEPEKSVLKASQARLAKIEEHIGPLPFEDRSFVLGLLGRAYNAKIKAISN